jgi:hypothetical protein
MDKEVARYSLFLGIVMLIVGLFFAMIVFVEDSVLIFLSLVVLPGLAISLFGLWHLIRVE